MGRYEDFTAKNASGNYIPRQDADNYTQEITIEYYYIELASNSYDTANTVAKSLSNFVTKTKANGGYYIGRYEASYKDSTHCYSKKSVSTRVENTYTDLTSGMLWNFISQSDAATIARNSFTSSYVDSDLVNSYAWDTAIIFIQKYSGNSSYANKIPESPSLNNTGFNNDKVCNIHDMAMNGMEWSTEHCPRTIYGYGSYCVLRGGHVHGTGTTGIRSWVDAGGGSEVDVFRSVCYIK